MSFTPSVSPRADLFDDPTSRTRKAWSRTLLIISVLTALLLRAVFVLGKPWGVGAVLLAISAAMIILGLARMRMLAKHGSDAGRRPARRTYASLTVGVLCLAGVGVVFALL